MAACGGASASDVAPAALAIARWYAAARRADDGLEEASDAEMLRRLGVVTADDVLTHDGPVIDAVFLNGTVGSGKSTVADALSVLVEDRAHAVVDLDELRRLRPASSADPFHHEVELANLASLASNYRAAGAEAFIIAGVVEERAEVARYVDALGSGGMLLCQLVASPEVLSRRLRARHADDPDGLRWHLARAGELAQVLQVSAADDLVLDSSRSTPAELAETIRRAAGWG